MVCGTSSNWPQGVSLRQEAGQVSRLAVKSCSGAEMTLTGRRTILHFLPAILVAWCLTSSAPAQGHASSQAPQTSAALPGSTGGPYAETDICKTCHQEVWEKHFAGTPHAALLKGSQHGCQSCHGPGQAHVDGGGDPTKIIRFEMLSPAQTARSAPDVISRASRPRTFPSPNT